MAGFAPTQVAYRRARAVMIKVNQRVAEKKTVVQSDQQTVG